MDTNENTQGRASYTGEERRELIEEFNSSGMTQAAFCREWNINPVTLDALPTMKQTEASDWTPARWKSSREKQSA